MKPPMDKRYHSVLFDLDGTVLDTSSGILKAVDGTIRQCGFPDIPWEQKRSMIGPPIQRSLQRIYGLTAEQTAEAASVFRQLYAEKYLMDAVPYPGIHELLRRLREDGWKVGIATYKRDDYAQRLMGEMGISALCDVALGSDGKQQTKADIIQICLRGMECPHPSACVMVGDTVHDWEGARNAGTAFVGVTYGFGFTSAKEVLNLSALGAADSVPDLKEILRKLHS